MTTSKSGVKLDTTKSDKIVERFRQSEFKAKRKRSVFTGTWNATVEDLFPLLCPAREADWIPGWDADLIYTESGYAEDNCVFITDTSCSVGEGIWVFTGYKLNDYIEFVMVQEDVITRARITVKDNQDGTVSGTWDVLLTALTERGNRELEKTSEDDISASNPLLKMIEHYLGKGKAISPAALMLDGALHHVKAHIS
jgi:hypothetical protein